MRRLRVGAIIVVEDKLVTMYREYDNRKYYTFPGGGIEDYESEVECVIREVKEEFGISVAPIEKLYDYENGISKESFYLCAWLTGKFGTGTGEEFQNKKYGIYKPTLIKIKDIPSLPLMPPEIANKFYNDYKLNPTKFKDNKVISGTLAK